MEEMGEEAVSRFRRQLVMASYAQAEHQLNSSKAALMSVNSQYIFYRMQVVLLTQFIEGFHRELSFLFKSTQWKVGDRLARALKRMTGRSPQSMAKANYEKSYAQYSQWKRGFESRAKVQILNGILSETDEFASPVEAANRVRRLDGLAAVLRQETEAAKQDVQYLLEQYVELEKRYKMIRKSLHFRLGLILVRQLARFRRDPNSALYLAHLQARSLHFKNWLSSYRAAIADEVSGL